MLCSVDFYLSRQVQGNRLTLKTIIYLRSWGRMTRSVIMRICCKRREIICHLHLENAKRAKSRFVLLKTLTTLISHLLMLTMHLHHVETTVRQTFRSYQLWATFNVPYSKAVRIPTSDLAPSRTD